MFSTIGWVRRFTDGGYTSTSGRQVDNIESVQGLEVIVGEGLDVVVGKVDLLPTAALALGLHDDGDRAHFAREPGPLAPR